MGRAVRNDVDNLVEELNNLYPWLKKHTNMEIFKYRVVQGLTCVRLMCVFFVGALFSALVSAGGSLITRVFWGVVCAVFFIGFVFSLARFYKNANNDTVEVMRCEKTYERLAAELDEAQKLMHDFDVALESQILKDFLRLGEIMSEDKVGKLIIPCDIPPFEAYGEILGEDFSYKLTDDNYNKLLIRVACASCGKDSIQSFKELRLQS